MKISLWVQTVLAIALAARHAAASQDDPVVGEGFDFLHGTVASATEKIVGTLRPNTPEATKQVSTSGGYFAPFGTDAPSEELFQRNGSLAKLAPIINVADEALNQPIPTNKWWGNLIHVTATNRSENFPAWVNPYALMLPKQAPFGLQTFYPYSYREMAPEVNGSVKWYTHGVHNDLTLSAQEFFNASKPNYEVYHWDDIGIKLRMCDQTNMTCMDSALVSGMAFVSATYDAAYRHGARHRRRGRFGAGQVRHPPQQQPDVGAVRQRQEPLAP
ncbi:hypothetical protein PF004_g29909, partial [Phytophthora fragariae]